MKEILLGLETMNLEWARRRVRTARSMQRGMFWQAGLFLFFGAVFFVWYALGGSWWNLITVAIYFAGGMFFLRLARTKYALMVWRALRSEAEAKVRVRKIMEENA